jgi:predicted AAA+ superfamily ATPase
MCSRKRRHLMQLTESQQNSNKITEKSQEIATELFFTSSKFSVVTKFTSARKATYVRVVARFVLRKRAATPALQIAP